MVPLVVLISCTAALHGEKNRAAVGEMKGVAR
jgi:hypothetical protein